MNQWKNIFVKKLSLSLLIFLILTLTITLTACNSQQSQSSNQAQSIGIIGGADGDTAIYITNNTPLKNNANANRTLTNTNKLILQNTENISYSPDARHYVIQYIEPLDGKYEIKIYRADTNILVAEFNDLPSEKYEFLWSNDSSKLCITIIARVWKEISIIDIHTGEAIANLSALDVINKIKKQGIDLQYTLQDSRPDPYIFPVEWVEDNSKIMLSYQWTDTDSKRQSGTFMFDLGDKTISQISQNHPEQW